MIALKDKMEILNVIGQKGKLNILNTYKDKDGNVITQYEKNGFTWAVRI